MRILLTLFLSAASLLAGDPIVMVVSPNGPFTKLSRANAVDLLKGDATQIGGKRVTLVLTKPSFTLRSLPAVTYGLLGLAPTAYLALTKQAKMRGIPLDPQFMDTPEAVEASVAANSAAVGFLLKAEAKGAGVTLISLD